MVNKLLYNRMEVDGLRLQDFERIETKITIFDFKVCLK